MIHMFLSHIIISLKTPYQKKLFTNFNSLIIIKYFFKSCKILKFFSMMQIYFDKSKKIPCAKIYIYIFSIFLFIYIYLYI